jgi:DNA-directed RNA polymerase subunit F
MNRFGKLILAVAGAAAVSGLLLYLAPSSVDRQSGQPAETPSIVASDADPALTGTVAEHATRRAGDQPKSAGSAAASTGTVRDESSSILATAKSYSEAITESRLRTGDDMDAINERIRLASVCGSIAMSERVQQLQSKEVAPSRRAQIEFFEKFCDAEAESLDPLIAEMEKHSESDVVKATILHETTAIDPRTGVEEAMRILFESDSPSALTAAGRFLDESARVKLDFGLADATKLPDGIEPNVVRRLAIEMIACELSRACGPNSAEAWLFCDRIGACRPGVSMQDIWRASYPPVVYDAAVRQANFLRSIRSSK